MKFKTLFFGILLSTFFITSSYSFNLNKVYNLKTFSSAKLEINDTNLVEKKNEKNLLLNNKNLRHALKEESKAIQEFNIAQPIGDGILADVNLLDAGSHIGINTIGQSLRNANIQLRSEPPNPQVNVSPWMNTTIGPDLPRRPLEIGESCSA